MSVPTLPKRVLIANRCEVAIRIQSTCRSLGIATIAIFAPEDRAASFVYSADAAYPLGKSGYAGYLDQDEIIAIAQKSAADAIHPGYGFLSENSSFAQKVIDVGLMWIGPHPTAMHAMADKDEARTLMQSINVPLVPALTLRDFSDQHCAVIKQQASQLGYPLIIKDPRGGGGKGMRKVSNESEFDATLQTVISEVTRMTGSSTLLIEKYVNHGRHIEIQIAGDGHRFIHLFERECSLQRRHQKVIEETPCNFLSSNILERMYHYALAIAAHVNYNSIGTIEFIVTPDGEFYFLEMNTRLQVEHAVTEMTTGVDLVELQIYLASGNQLDYEQTDITSHGHAVQCRLYAENPIENFMPSTGVISYLNIPRDPYIRIEHDLAQGGEITPLFDPMIAKFVVAGATRDTCIQRMTAFLEKFSINGITTNKSFLIALLASEEFKTGNIHTQLISNHSFMDAIKNCLEEKDIDQGTKMLAAVAAYLYEHESKKSPFIAASTTSFNDHDSVAQRPWKTLQWR